MTNAIRKSAVITNIRGPSEIGVCVRVVSAARVATSIVDTIRVREYYAAFDTVTVMLRPSSIGGDNAKAQFERIGKRRDTLGASRVLANNDGFSPILHVALDPFGDGRLSNEIVDRTSEEAL